MQARISLPNVKVTIAGPRVGLYMGLNWKPHQHKVENACSKMQSTETLATRNADAGMLPTRPAILEAFSLRLDDSDRCVNCLIRLRKGNDPQERGGLS